MQAKVAALLGFASKSKKLVSGESAAEAMLKKGKAKLVILAADLAVNSQVKYRQWCTDLGVPVLIMGTKQVLGISIGLSPRSIVVVTDGKFAQSILQVEGSLAKE
ncbi:MAG: ribosomal L7Ae/L30e/S12e/Gadd45 family protein [Peptococcaceae bacterium]|nr:ribosomal L7Ae/L30e/S12e/Gadd45 family protein [Peptococcaceae bacterium]